MGQHAEHTMHENSLKAYEEELPKLNPRAGAVLRAAVRYQAVGGTVALTDRTIMRLLGFADPNSVRPRITELLKAGLLVEGGKIKDSTTGKTVRTVRVSAAQLRLI